MKTNIIVALVSFAFGVGLARLYWAQSIAKAKSAEAWLAGEVERVPAWLSGLVKKI